MNKNERIAKAHYTDYLNSNSRYLWDVYAKFSDNKWNAYNGCVRLMHSLNGFDLRILSHNSQTFTVGFQFADSETGVLKFAYITKDYNRFCEV